MTGFAKWEMRSYLVELLDHEYTKEIEGLRCKEPCEFCRVLEQIYIDLNRRIGKEVHYTVAHKMVANHVSS